MRGKKHGKRKSTKSFLRKQRKLDKQQRWFIDSSVFLEAVLVSDSKWLEFLMNFRGSKRIPVTSTHAIGEVIRRIYRLETLRSKFDAREVILNFHDILEKVKVITENVDYKTFKLCADIIDFDSRIEFKDAIHIAVARQRFCVCFCSVDEGITTQTLKKFGLKKVETP